MSTKKAERRNVVHLVETETEPDHDTVKVLEDLLESARRGDLVGLLGVTVHQKSAEPVAIVQIGRIPMFPALGALRALEIDFTNEHLYATDLDEV